MEQKVYLKGTGDTSLGNLTVGSRNILLNSATNFPNAYSGTTRTTVENVTVSEWGTTEALRVYGKGGTKQVILIFNADSHGISQVNPKYIDGMTYVVSAYIKNNGAKTVYLTPNVPNTVYGEMISIAPNEQKRVVYKFRGNGTSNVQMQFLTDAIGDNYDITYWHPMIAIGNSVADWSPAPEDIEYQISVVDGALNSFVTTVYPRDIKSLQDQIDGNITTWFYEVDPTLTNAPAKDWKTDKDKNIHLGDIYYNTVSGYAWRWMLENGTYTWQKLSDSDISKALEAAAKAQDTADHKRRVFYSQPVPPYDAGDLWVQGSEGDILRCAVAKESGTYAKSDWVLASKYTDDSALTNFISGDYATTINEVRTSIDGKIETFYQDNDPALAWTTADDKAKHKGDLWYKTTDSTTWRYTGSAWAEQNAPKEVFDRIDGKAQIFIIQPKPPYSVGDLWFNSTTSGIMTCIKARATGNYTASDWQERNKYVDATAVGRSIDAKLVDYTKTTDINTRFEETDESIAAVVSSVTAVDAKYDNALKNYSTTSEVESKISTAKDEIELSVSENYTSKTTFDALAVGGVNILRGTREITPGTGTWATGTFRASGGRMTVVDVTDSPIKEITKAVKLTSTTSVRNGFCQDAYSMRGHVGDTLAYSLWAKGQQGQVVRLQAFWTNKTGETESSGKNITLTSDGWEHLSYVTPKIQYDHNAISIGYVYLEQPEDGEIECLILGQKLEWGNKVTDWSPAPEDDMYFITNNYRDNDYIDANYYTQTQVNNAIKVNTDGIELRASKTYGSNNMLLPTPKLENLTGYRFEELWLTDNLRAGQEYTLQLWGVTFNNTGTTKDIVRVYWGGGSVTLKDNLVPDENGYIITTFTPTKAQSEHATAVNPWLCLYNTSNPGTTGTRGITISNWQLTKGNNTGSKELPYATPRDSVGTTEVISKINVSPESITINADRVNIEGATIFSSGRLSTTSLNNAYDSKGSATSALNSAKNYTDNVKVGGTNLFIEKTSVAGYVGTDGNVAPNNATRLERTSDFIPVSNGDHIIFQVWIEETNNENSWMGYCFYDANKELVGSRVASARPANNEHYYKYEADVPSGASYLRVSSRTYGAIGNVKIKVEIGDKSTDYSTSPQDLETVTSDNLLMNSETAIPLVYNTATISRFERNVTVNEWLTNEGIRVIGTTGGSLYSLRFSNASHGINATSSIPILNQQYVVGVYIKNNHATKVATTRPFFGNLTNYPGVTIQPGDAKLVTWVGYGAGNSELSFVIGGDTTNSDYDITYWHPFIAYGRIPLWNPSSVDATNRANEYETATNMSPFFSNVPYSKGNYWKYDWGATYFDFEPLEDGWVHVKKKTIEDVERRLDIHLTVNDKVKKGTDYTFLFEFRNNNATGTTVNASFYIVKNDNYQFYGDGIKENIEGLGMTSSGTNFATQFPPGTQGVYTKRFVKTSEAAGSEHLPGEPNGMVRFVWLVPKNANLDIETRVSMYEGRYTGNYKPYIPEINDIVSEQQNIYISKKSATASVPANTAWVTNTNNVQNTWTTTRPTYDSEFPVLFIAQQSKTVNGIVTCTTPVIDETTTVIDGGHITTGTIDANRLNVRDIITKGSIAVTSDIPTKVSQLTNDSSYQTASQVSSAITTGVSGKADKTTAVSEEQYIYISQQSGTTSVPATTTWVPESGNIQNTWTTTRPTYNSEFPVLFIAKQKKVVNGTVTCTTPVMDQTTTVIDGGHITTGIIDASKVNVRNLNASNITTGTLNAINITGSDITGATITGSTFNFGTGDFKVTQKYYEETRAGTLAGGVEFSGTGEIVLESENTTDNSRAGIEILDFTHATVQQGRMIYISSTEGQESSSIQVQSNGVSVFGEDAIYLGLNAGGSIYTNEYALRILNTGAVEAYAKSNAQQKNYWVNLGNVAESKIGQLDNVNLDDIYSDKWAGTYYVNMSAATVTGTKPTNIQGALVCKRQADNYFRQMFFANNGKQYVRYWNESSSAWTTWSQDALSTKVDTITWTKDAVRKLANMYLKENVSVTWGTATYAQINLGNLSSYLTGTVRTVTVTPRNKNTSPVSATIVNGSVSGTVVTLFRSTSTDLGTVIYDILLVAS